MTRPIQIREMIAAFSPSYNTINPCVLIDVQLEDGTNSWYVAYAHQMQPLLSLIDNKPIRTLEYLMTDMSNRNERFILDISEAYKKVKHNLEIQLKEKQEEIDAMQKRIEELER